MILELLAPAPIILLLHELSHAAAVKLLKGTVKTFKPYPHRHNDRWYLGRVAFSLPERNRWVYATPLAFNIPLTILALIFHPILAIWPALDFLAWMRGYLGISLPWSKADGLDGWKFRAFNKFHKEQ